MPTIITSGGATAKAYGFGSGKTPKGTFANPGVSAQDILSSGQTVSDWYYIKTSTMSTPLQVYCNMTDNGGGWMLVGYHPSSSTSNNGNPIPVNWLNGNGTFPSGTAMTANLNDLWFNNGSPQCISAMRMGTTTTNQIPLLANMQIAYYVVYASGAFQFPSTGFSPASYTLNPANGISLTWYNLLGYTAMTGPLSSNAPIDWMYNAGSNYYYTICGPSSDVQPSGRSGSGNGTGSWTNSVNNNMYGLANVSTTTSSGSSTIQTYALYIR